MATKIAKKTTSPLPFPVAYELQHHALTVRSLEGLPTVSAFSSLFY